jgi:hypothetical protein
VTEFYVVEAGKPDRLLMTVPGMRVMSYGRWLTLYVNGEAHHYQVWEAQHVLDAVTNAPDVVKLKEIESDGILLLRYQECVERLLKLFLHDPLPDSCKAQSYIERFEALLDLRLVGPTDTDRDQAFRRLLNAVQVFLALITAGGVVSEKTDEILLQKVREAVAEGERICP